MKRLARTLVFVFSLSLVASECAVAADDSKLKNATNRVERGVKDVPDGKVGKSATPSPKAQSTAAKR